MNMALSTGLASINDPLFAPFNIKCSICRDIKLQNFMFETKSKGSPLKLIDFGLSKHFDESELMGRLVGTPYYIAPEVWKGRYDERCDIWSLGICAYILLMGAMPFDGVDLEDCRNHILKSEPVFSNQHCTASDEATHFLQQLLRKDPNTRIDLTACYEHPFMVEIFVLVILRRFKIALVL